jgi:hypothetical protein
MVGSWGLGATASEDLSLELELDSLAPVKLADYWGHVIVFHCDLKRDTEPGAPSQSHQDSWPSDCLWDNDLYKKDAKFGGELYSSA